MNRFLHRLAIAVLMTASLLGPLARVDANPPVSSPRSTPQPRVSPPQRVSPPIRVTPPHRVVQPTPARPVVQIRPSIYSLYYRVSPQTPWIAAGQFSSLSQAMSYQNLIQSRGYQTFVR